MAADELMIEVVTLDREVIRDSASEVQLPGSTGYLGILPGHTPLLTEVGIGILSYRKGDETLYAAVSGGVTEVLPDRVTVLADTAERADEIDVDRARVALSTAGAKYASAASDPSTDWDAVQQTVARAEARLEVASHAGSPKVSTAHT